MVNLQQVQAEIKEEKTSTSQPFFTSVSVLFWLPPPTSVVALQYFCLPSVSSGSVSPETAPLQMGG